MLCCWCSVDVDDQDTGTENGNIYMHSGPEPAQNHIYLGLARAAEGPPNAPERREPDYEQTQQEESQYAHVPV